MVAKYITKVGIINQENRIKPYRQKPVIKLIRQAHVTKFYIAGIQCTQFDLVIEAIVYCSLAGLLLTHLHNANSG